MLSNPQPKLTFGALNLIGLPTDIANFGYTFEALGDDTDWGNPVPVDQKVISWLQDGAIIARKNYDNREILVRIRVRANDSAGLAAGESALMLETGKPNLLTWTPPDGVGAPCVFSVVMSNLEHVFDDLDEDRLLRVYGLRIQAEPFVRSSTLVAVSKAAPTGTQTITLVDNCTSATNWTQTTQVGTNTPVTTAATVTGGTAVQGFAGPTAGTVTRLSLTRSSLAVSMSTTPYLRIDMATTGPVLANGASWASGYSDFLFKVNGTALPVAIQAGSIYWLDVSSVGVTTLTTLEAYGYFTSGGQAAATIADVSRSNVLGDQGTGRQLLRSLPIAGSARTQASLAVADASSSLGTALVYTYPQAAGIVAPSIRQFYTTGGFVTTDATTVFGSTMTMDGPPQFLIPASQLQPGGYLMLARMKHASAGSRTVSWLATAQQGSSSVGGSSSVTGVSGSATFTSTAGGWVMVTLGTISLPVAKMGSAGKLYFQMLEPSGSVLDEAWFFNLDTGDLTWVECGTASPSGGGSANRLWLDSPTVTSPTPAAYLGFASDRSDSYHAANLGGTSGGLRAFGNHSFVPPAMNVFTVTTNSTASAITLSHYPRWHTHAVS